MGLVRQRFVLGPRRRLDRSLRAPTAPYALAGPTGPTGRVRSASPVLLPAISAASSMTRRAPSAAACRTVNSLISHWPPGSRLRPGPPAHRARTGRAFAVPRVQPARAAHRACRPPPEHSRHDRRHRAGQYGGAGPGARRKTGPGGLPEHPVGGRVIRIPAGQCVRRRAGPGVVGGHRERGRRSPGGELALRAGDLAQVEARPAQGHGHRQLEVSAVPEHGHVAGQQIRIGSGVVRPVAEPPEQRAGERAGRVRYGHQDAPSAASAKLTTLTSARHAAKSQLNRLENYESSVPTPAVPPVPAAGGAPVPAAGGAPGTGGRRCPRTGGRQRPARMATRVPRAKREPVRD